MRRLAFLSLSIILFAFTRRDSAEDLLGLKGPYQFNNTRFDLAYSVKNGEAYYIQEYLPKGENLDSYTQMLSYQVLDVDMTVEKAVDIKREELENRKKIDPICQYRIIENSDKSSYIADFVMSDTTGGDVRILEFNIYRYQFVKTAKKKKGVLLYSYTARRYDNASAKTYLLGLKDERQRLIGEMMQAKMPDGVLNAR